MSNFIEKKLLHQCISEFLGLGVVIFFGVSCLCASVLAGANFSLWEICIVWGVAFALGIYLSAGVSGAHLNPAVTIALWRYANFDGNKVVPYIVAQTAGAFSGAALAYLIYHNLFDVYELANGITRGSVDSLSLAGLFSTYPHSDISILQAGVVEFVITAVLMLLIMALTDDGNGLPRGPLAPLLIGLLVAVIGAATAPLTGFALNPARDFGPKLFTAMSGWGEIAFTGGSVFPYFIVPIVAPILGACAGASLYSFKPREESDAQPETADASAQS
ncbi:MIP/aquaporin family protein [Photobacterium sp. DNB23_23_1]|uniref:Aquaporin n=1 Tax=Photobacterium pectinilyticum TaxID=2906793 RepID=A0ABT1N4K6_9GAMM|nr:MIP/aquaporin family protein [Photobacterium sp. ZSDE20]MCQ1059659.1 aquaporin [Photobacterium sp. ZSDE20]MDD1825827.1 aquaporin [Photobacterium sp. ZSDE20]